MSLESRQHLTIAGPAGALQAIADEAEGEPQQRYAVICHPHPLYGGTMDNKVVYTLARALQSVGIATLRFNFRGVGASQGAYDEGAGETQDAAAVADFGAARWPGKRIVLAGFSFGSYVALRLAREREPSYLVTVAPPASMFDLAALPPPQCPWLVVQGDADEIVEPASVFAWVERLNPQPKLVVMPGVGHFFHGHLTELRDAVREALRSG